MLECGAGSRGRDGGCLQVDGSGLLRVHGRLTLSVLRPDGTVRDRRAGDNIMCTDGLSALAAALVWSGIEDQAAALGVTSPTYLTPMYGAVGSGAGMVAATDTALFTELGRQQVGAGAYAPAAPGVSATVTWLFFFPQPPTTWTVTEAGVFANATSAAGNGTLLDHWAFSPTLTVPTTDTLLLEAAFSVGA